MATELTWLGHASFRLDTPGGKRIYVDPFLHGNPKCPKLELEPERCDLILITHGHGDHVGDAVAIHQRFGCPVIAAVELREWLTTQGVADDGGSNSPNKGGTVAVDGVKATLTDANPSSSSRTATSSTSQATRTCSATCRSSGASTHRTSRSSRSATTSPWGRARLRSRSSCSASSAASPATTGRSACSREQRRSFASSRHPVSRSSCPTP